MTDEKKEDQEKKEDKDVKPEEVKEKKAPKPKTEGTFDGICNACGTPIDKFGVRCECGNIVHVFCVDSHIMKKHRPVTMGISITKGIQSYKWEKRESLIE